MENLYYVYNMYNVAYLVQKGFEVIKLDKVDGTLMFFFEDSPELKEAVEAMKYDDDYNDYVRCFLDVKNMFFKKKAEDR
ncbi:hypothetical protein EDC18_102404 [Natranaerovirga pectinivora]|uniref:DUF5659 domain-containing protein n=1 Tax=Natranaerovirga pectinivora TaxID=682400 RepID=A0A4R3MN17_9FIRM|nr:DUF5659 domain-containing protein [Natranaerovirga pectinivora]TCT16385.1 hypothetical protein EDC18_102404 [Natranaerovirga pectinivora]